MIVPKGFFPGGHRLPDRRHRGRHRHLVRGDGASGSSKVAEIVRRIQAVDYVNSTVGAGGPNPTTNYGRMFIALKPEGASASRRPRSCSACGQVPPTCPGMQRSSIRSRTSTSAAASPRAEYQYTLQSGDTEALYRIAPEMRDKIAKLPGLLDVTTDLYIKNPQMTVEIDREKAAVYGITVDQIRQELFNAFGSRQVATIYTPSNDYQVILEACREFQADPSDLSKLYLKTNGQAIAARIERGGALRLVADGRPAAGQPPGPAAGGDDLVQPRARLLARPGGRRHPATIERDSRLPATIATGFQGTAQVFQDR